MKGPSIVTYIVLIFSVIYAFILPLAEDISILLDQKKIYEDSLKKALEIEKIKNDLLAEFNNISAADRRKVETFIPGSVSLVKLVSDIDATAAKQGLSIDKITSSGSVASPSAASLEETPIGTNYQSMNIGFSFIAPYEKFESLLGDLERSLRILDIRSMKISPRLGNLYNYDVEFETYWSP